MKFKKDFLRNLAWDDRSVAGVKVIEKKLNYRSDWTVGYAMVFEYNGKLYATSYSEGATENQVECPYDGEPNEIECKEVKPVEKTIIVYE